MSKAARRKRLKNAAPMIKILDGGTWPIKATVTLETLLRHYEKHGWDRKRQGSGRKRRWIDKTYRTYHQMRNDSLVEIARSYLDRDDYLELVSTLGKPEFVEQAIDEEGWNLENGEQNGADVYSRGYGGELGGAQSNDGHDSSDPTQEYPEGSDSRHKGVQGQVPGLPTRLVYSG